MVNSSAVRADTKLSKCNDAIKKCDAALEKKNVVIKEQAVVIDNAVETINDLSVSNSEKTRQLDKKYRNPFLMAGVGAAAGLLVGGPIVIGVGFLIGILF